MMIGKSLDPSVASEQAWHLIQQARQTLGMDQPQHAEDLLERALVIAPDNTEAHRLMGIAALMTQKRDKAVTHLRQALKNKRDDAGVNMTLGSVLVETGEMAEGLACLERTCELAPGHATAWCNFGIGLELDKRWGSARDAFRRAVELDPEFIKARIKLALMEMRLGEAKRAVDLLRGSLRRQPDCADAWMVLGNLKTELFTRDDVGALRRLLRRSDMADSARIKLSFTLAKALEDQSDYADAFDVVREANALKRKQLYWSREEECDRVRAISKAFAKPVEGVQDDTAFGHEIIFIAHLPRAGSTLTEQILASHPDVQSGDETQILPDILDEESERRGKHFPSWVDEATAADWRRLGACYMERTRPLRKGSPRFTDKTPNNWAFVGAIFAMLPGARVVNARRDPLETCFACYRQMFAGGCHYTYDLDDMVAYYAGYDRLSAQWRALFAERYFESHYEALQADLEQHVRRLLDFCDLSFDAACLEFHKTQRTVQTISAAQVREPLRRDTARSALYGICLNPLRDKLAAAGVTIAGGR
jgi:Tfp pilus assembly protein PilF